MHGRANLSDELKPLSTSAPAAASRWCNGYLHTPAMFQSTAFNQVEISAELRPDQTTFLCHEDGKLYCFWRELFLIDGSFPAAAD
jgi:hypothetical protein